MNLVLRVKEHRLLGPVYRRLTSIVEVVPYYLVREVLADVPEAELQPRVGRVEVGFLDRSEVRSLAQNREVPEGESVLMKRLDDGCLCLGARHHGVLAAYSWCSLARCDYDGRLTFPLGETEAYLFDARTFSAYRGMKLAGHVRHRLYRELERMGRNRFYSMSSCLNTAALRFKEQLKARRVRLYIHVRLFGRLNANLLLRRYARADDPLCMSKPA